LPPTEANFWLLPIAGLALLPLGALDGFGDALARLKRALLAGWGRPESFAFVLPVSLLLGGRLLFPPPQFVPCRPTNEAVGPDFGRVLAAKGPSELPSGRFLDLTEHLLGGGL
jgi:hypothetical protein